MPGHASQVGDCVAGDSFAIGSCPGNKIPRIMALLMPKWFIMSQVSFPCLFCWQLFYLFACKYMPWFHHVHQVMDTHTEMPGFSSFPWWPFSITHFANRECEGRDGQGRAWMACQSKEDSLFNMKWVQIPQDMVVWSLLIRTCGCFDEIYIWLLDRRNA